ncbi:hypothetical protein MMC30_008990 [Trapelia coarctata]|nr:hypothetical protein [Trapelia coarctata]
MDAKTRFLSSAALSYATTAPATASYLMFRCQELSMSDSGALPTSLSNMACAACGCIDIPGWTSHRQMGRKAETASQKATPSARELSTEVVATTIIPPGPTKSSVTTKVLETHCLLCRRTAKSPVQGKGRIKNPTKAEGNRKQEQGSDHTLRKEKRSKTRPNSGLLAILAQSKAASTPAPELDLMDLMKVV